MHNITVYGVGYDNATDTDSETVWFTVDTVKPLVTLVSPENYCNASNTSIDFQFIVTDNIATTLNCSLYINDLLVNTNSSTHNGTLITFSETVSEGNNQNWTVNCSDSAGNTDQTDVRYFSVPLYTGWWNSSWSYRQKISIPNTNTEDDLTNYQIKIELNSSNIGSNWNWNNDGNDTRFTYYNSTSRIETEIPFWIEEWNLTAQTAVIWVKVPLIRTNIDFQIEKINLANK